MQINNNNFILTIDRLTAERCEGWYIRKDGMDNYLIFQVDGNSHPVLPSVSRPDVAAQGLGDEICGFVYQFPEPLKDGNQLVIRDSTSARIFNKKIAHKDYQSTALNTRMIRMVEPFVEMDIAKVRASLMENRIYEQYKKLFTETLAEKSDEELKDALVNIMADMQTTMHLLCAAYLDYTRYKDPEFMVSLPEFCPNVTDKFAIVLNGKITGSNWSEPENGGRWLEAAKRASILLPNPGPGEYAIEVVVSDGSIPGIADKLELQINGQNCDLERQGDILPCVLAGRVELKPETFLVIHFMLPVTDDLMEQPEKAIKISEVRFSRIPA